MDRVYKHLDRVADRILIMLEKDLHEITDAESMMIKHTCDYYVSVHTFAKCHEDVEDEMSEEHDEDNPTSRGRSYRR